jgi:hypothetical protein
MNPSRCGSFERHRAIRFHEIAFSTGRDCQYDRPCFQAGRRILLGGQMDPGLKIVIVDEGAARACILEDGLREAADMLK